MSFNHLSNEDDIETRAIRKEHHMGEERLLFNTHMGKQLLSPNTVPMIVLGTNS